MPLTSILLMTSMLIKTKSYHFIYFIIRNKAIPPTTILGKVVSNKDDLFVKLGTFVVPKNEKKEISTQNGNEEKKQDTKNSSNNNDNVTKLSSPDMKRLFLSIYYFIYFIFNNCFLLGK